MKKNKYLMFVSIGFELVGLILAAIWVGKYLTDTMQFTNAAQAICVLVAFLIWFISLFLKLRSLKSD